MTRRWAIALVLIIAAAATLVGLQLYTTRGTKQAAAPTTGAPGSGSAIATAPLGAPGVIPPLPKGASSTPAEAAGPAKDGVQLHPMASAPLDVVAAVATRIVPAGATYSVRFRPWGFGPASTFGQTLVVTVTRVEAKDGAPSIDSLSRHPMLFVMNAAEGGDVADGGLRTGTVVFKEDAGRVVPFLTGTAPTSP